MKFLYVVYHAAIPNNFLFFGEDSTLKTPRKEAESQNSSRNLLIREMLYEIEEIVKNAGAILFPRGRHDLRTRCSCPDYVKTPVNILPPYITS